MVSVPQPENSGWHLTQMLQELEYEGWVAIVAPQSMRTHIFEACHHHKLAAQQGIVCTLSLIKRRFYWPNKHQDVDSWCQCCSVCGRCKAAVHGHEQLQQPTYGSFNERVSVDMRGPFKQTQDSNDYIVVIQDHFTKLVEGRAICAKEALTVDDAVVQDWVLKLGPLFHFTVIEAASSSRNSIKESATYYVSPRCTLQLTTHRPMAWWNGT